MFYILKKGRLSMEQIFQLRSEYQPQGDQPTAIAALVQGINEKKSIKFCLVQRVQGKPLRWPM